MALTFTTWESGFIGCPVGYCGWGATGTNMVSVGVQAEGNQQSLAVVQCFVNGAGTASYVQVANNGFSKTINFQFIIVSVYDDDVSAADAAPPILMDAVVQARDS